MNKASIIKDAIDYIIQLQDEERQTKAEISELESKLKQESTSVDDLSRLENLHFSQRKKKRTASAPSSPRSPPIQVVEVVTRSLSLIHFLTIDYENKTAYSISEID